MFEFDTSAYGKAVAELLLPQRLPELGPGTPNSAALTDLRRLTDERMFGAGRVRDTSMAAACRAALWLHHDYLDESHQISQSLDDSSGSYWHGIMHRREPDAANAKYWFRRVPTHAIYPQLCAMTLKLAETDGTVAEADRQAVRSLTGGDTWDPTRFVDLCEIARTSDPGKQLLARRIQLREWQLLFDHCFRLAGIENEESRIKNQGREGVA